MFLFETSAIDSLGSNVVFGMGRGTTVISPTGRMAVGVIWYKTFGVTSPTPRANDAVQQ